MKYGSTRKQDIFSAARSVAGDPARYWLTAGVITFIFLDWKDFKLFFQGQFYIQELFAMGMEGRC